ncbi:hypothetical protein [Streptomyces sp. NPDC057301]|uniref:hypothetical protein n=1 Tax=Streptomyces sp. NPDC057301 TaxID=3346093 RepID=UPI0036392C39
MSRLADDGYDRVYAEYLWSLIPAVHREADAPSDGRGVLRAFTETVAAELAAARRSVDRLGEDPFVERADDWAVPYLADLVATRLVSALNPRGQRVEVAKTVYYRRRKGTPRVLEELIADITGWDGVVVEMFRRLGRFRHALDPAPGPIAGPVTGTGPGGLADLRALRGTELARGPFDEYHHTPDLRRPRGTAGGHGTPGIRGVHGIHQAAFHLYRLPAWRITGAVPGAPGTDASLRTLDPSGRAVPLFQRRRRPEDWEEWRSVRPWELAAPMGCRVLGDAVYVITDSVLKTLRAAGLSAATAKDLGRLAGRRLAGEAALLRAVRALPASSSAGVQAGPVWEALRAAALAPDCGKAALLPGSLDLETAPGTTVPPHRVAVGALVSPAALPPGADVLVDPEHGRVRFAAPPSSSAALRATYHIGFPGPVGAGPWDRSAAVLPADATLAGGGAIPSGSVRPDGVTRIVDSLTYSGLPKAAGVRKMCVQAADRQRPYVRLGGEWELEAEASAPAELVLDGLWLGAGNTPAAVRLRGSFRSVVLRHVTLDPGGTDACGGVLAPVSLTVEGHVECLTIDRSVCGPLAVTGSVETVVLRDAILHATGTVPALDAPGALLDAARATVIGPIAVNRMKATELLATDEVTVTDTQYGCFRFGAALAGSRLPRPYRSHVLTSSKGLFTSRVFGRPGYTQLALTAPREVARGAEDTSETGVWSSLRGPVRLDGLLTKAGEYAPFDLVPHVVFET